MLLVTLAVQVTFGGGITFVGLRTLITRGDLTGLLAVTFGLVLFGLMTVAVVQIARAMASLCLAVRTLEMSSAEAVLHTRALGIAVDPPQRIAAADVAGVLTPAQGGLELERPDGTGVAWTSLSREEAEWVAEQAQRRLGLKGGGKASA